MIGYVFASLLCNVIFGPKNVLVAVVATVSIPLVITFTVFVSTLFLCSFHFVELNDNNIFSLCRYGTALTSTNVGYVTCMPATGNRIGK